MSRVRRHLPGGGESGRFLGRAGLGVLLVVLLTATATATAALLTVKGIIDNGGDAPPSIRTATPIPEAPPGGAQTLLLIGSDRRWQDLKQNNPLLKVSNPARSDTMLLVRIDPAHGATNVLSMPRDLQALIPGHGIDKLNASYSTGGADLTRRTIESLLPGVHINHIINANFRGFRQVVDAIGCVYTDVDRRYFHSNAGLPVSRRWAEIDIEPGYQRLCGQRALDYVRYRHTDTDLVRADRQQTFLRDAKDQVSTSALVGQLDRLIRVVRRNTQTDAGLSSVKGALRLGELALYASDKPVVQIPFPPVYSGDYVVASPATLQRLADRFLHARPQPRTTKPQSGRRQSQRRMIAQAPLSDGRAAGRLAVAAAVRGRRVGLPVYVPAKLTAQGRYIAPDNGAPVGPRLYSIRDRAGRQHRAYRLVIAQNPTLGEYYGVQGTTWLTPPILAHPDAVTRIDGRTLKLFKSGSRLRLVSWRKGPAVYWVSNDLSLSLSNGQMLGIAASLTRAR